MRLGDLIALRDVGDIAGGGPGSGCHGDNCGRPSSGVASAISTLNEKYPVNPNNKAERMFLVGGKPAATFEIAEREGRLRLKTIHSVEPGSGVGSLLLGRIVKVADAHGVTIELTSSPYGDETNRISHEKLGAWYEKHGFKKESGFDESLGYMVRSPKGSSSGVDVDSDAGINWRSHEGELLS